MDTLKLTGATIVGLSIINFDEIEFRQRTGKLSPVNTYFSIFILISYIVNNYL